MAAENIPTARGLPALRVRLGRWREDLRWRYGLRGLPRSVISFQMQARRRAHRERDVFSLFSVTRPADIKTLLALAADRVEIVELGTATAWTTLTLALDDPRRHVVSFDPHDLAERRHYLSLVSADVRSRVELVTARGAVGPRESRPVELLYIDSSHEFQETIDEVLAWRDHLAPGALVIFDDYGHPAYPGVEQAVSELGLTGRRVGTLFVHEHR